MDFQNEMHQIFMQVAQGTLEPADWETWWHSHTDALKKQLSRECQTKCVTLLTGSLKTLIYTL